jgi:arsenate reductase
MSDPLRVLFLCTGNSARSLMAEAIANDRFGDRLRAASAGARPAGRAHPLALRTLALHGVATRGLRSKGTAEVAAERFDLVVTLCDGARGEPCPAFPGAPQTVHWSLPDPPAAADPQPLFEDVFAALLEAIGTLAEGSGAGEGAAAAARRAAEAARRRFPAPAPGTGADRYDCNPS